MKHQTLRAYLIFTGTGPLLLLSSYPAPLDPRMVEKLRYKGIEKFIAYEVPVEVARARYPGRFSPIADDLQTAEDARVLDFNGHQIMANFSLSELGEAVKFETAGEA